MIYSGGGGLSSPLSFSFESFASVSELESVDLMVESCFDSGLMSSCIS